MLQGPWNSSTEVTTVVRNEALAAAPVRIFCPAIHVWSLDPCLWLWKVTRIPSRLHAMCLGNLEFPTSPESPLRSATNPGGLRLKQLVIVFWRPSKKAFTEPQTDSRETHVAHLGETHWELDGLAKAIGISCNVVIPSCFNIQNCVSPPDIHQDVHFLMILTDLNCLLHFSQLLEKWHIPSYLSSHH